VSNSTVRFLKAIAGLAVVLTLLVMVMNWWGDYREAASNLASNTESTAGTTATQGTAVVLIEGLNFRKEPDTGSVTIRGLKKGEKLIVVASKPDWYQVKDSKKTVGWIAAKSQYVRIEK
jgi:uncharacterized protein YgiM (DUF1202 family)